MSSESSISVRDEAWSGSNNPLAKVVARPMVKFLAQEAASGALLIVATAAALIWANVDSESYSAFWESKFKLQVSDFAILNKSLKLIVNDALMAIFFFVVGLEIKSELTVGDLREPRVAALPAIAALGGMIVPAGLFLLVANGSVGANGWGVPMATDIAFAVGVLAILGKRIPQKLKLFLLTLAIVDDIGAILVIAVFYTEKINFASLSIALGLLILIIMLKRFRVWYMPVYVILGAAVWYATFKSGVHATIAGVALGLLAPAKPLLGDRMFESVEDLFSGDTADVEEVRDLNWKAREQVAVTSRLAAIVSPWSSFLIIPIFALANAGIVLSGDKISTAAESPITWGIIVGLVIGKPLGVFLFTLAATKLKLASLPAGVSWMHVLGGGAVAGIGFTVALFISELAFKSKEVSEAAIMGVLLASLLATILGAGILLTTKSPEVALDNVDPEADGEAVADAVENTRH